MNNEGGGQGERAARIRDLQAEIERIKRGGDLKTKTQGNDNDSEWKQHCLPPDAIVVRMLERENELRLSESVQVQFAEAERSSHSDWIEVASEVQRKVLREFGVSDRALHAYRCAANKHGISLYVKNNRARKGNLVVGSDVPDVSVVSVGIDGEDTKSILQFQKPDRPLVIVAGSLSWPPARYIVPAMYRDFVMSEQFGANTDFAFAYIHEAHATDEWPISSSRYMKGGEIVSVEQPRTLADRVSLARRFVDTFDIGPELTLLVDDPAKCNPFEEKFAPWPIRIYVLENSKMRYISAPTDCAHDVTELRSWLEKRHNCRA